LAGNVTFFPIRKNHRECNDKLPIWSHGLAQLLSRRNCADLSYVAGKPSLLTVFSKFAMPDLLTKDALPNDINSKLLSSELLNLFFGGGSMGELAADQVGLGQLAVMEPMASHTQCERKCTTTMMSLWHRTLIRCEHNGMHRQSHMGCSHVSCLGLDCVLACWA